MPAVSFHGVTIAWSVSGAARDPLAELLSVFPAAGGHAAARVRFAIEAAPESAAGDPRADGWEPSFFHGAVETFRGAAGFLIWDHASRVLVPHDGGPIDAQIAPAAREVTLGSTSTMLQLALILALRPAGFFHLHAAALVLPSGLPALVVGRTGAGKTTTTLALLEGGAAFLGDDSLYLTLAPDSDPGRLLELVAFPRDFHLGPATLATFPALAPFAGPSSPHSDKRPVDARRAYPGRFLSSIAIGRDSAAARAALALFPAVTTDTTTTIAPLARADAFGRLLGSSGALVVEGVPGRAQNFSALQTLLGAVRCYEIRLGADAIENPAAAIARPVSTLVTQGAGT